MEMPTAAKRLRHRLRYIFPLSVTFISAILVFNLLLVEGAAAQESSGANLGLSSLEKAWLAKHPTIGLAIDINWAPLEFVNEQKQYRGMAAEYIRLIEARLGIKFKVDRKRPWPKMVEAVKNHDLDAFSLVARTPQREEYLNFTKPYISLPMVIVSREGDPYIGDISELKNKTVSVVKSYASHDLLARNHPDIRLDPVDSVVEGLKAVSYGKAYAFVGNLAVTSEIIRETGITNLKVSGQTPYRFELGMAVRKDWPELIPILQKAFNSIPHEERDQIYNRWIRVKFQKQVDHQIVFIVLGVGLFIVSIVLIWNRTLRREVMHRKKAEEALRESEQKFRDYASTASDWFWEMGQDLKFTNVSGLNQETIGVDPTELIGKSFDDIIGHGTNEFEALQNLETLDERKAFKNFQFTFHNNTGQTNIFRVSGMPVFNDGKFAGYRGVGSDVTVYKKMGDEIRIRAIEAEAAQQTMERQAAEMVELAEKEASLNAKLKYEVDIKNRFFSIIAHDLKSPFTSLLGMTQLMSQMADGFSKDKLVEYANDVNEAADRVFELLQNLLEWSRLQMDGAKLEIKVIPLDRMTQESIDILKPIALEKDISLINKIKKTAAYADQDMVRTVIRNLIANSLKFTPSGGSVEVSSSRRGEMVKITVTDTGVGISEAQAEKIFSLDQKTSTTGTAGEKGTGLGLPLCKDMLERNGGSIWVESALGKGSKFHFTLPVGPAKEQP